MGEALLSVSGLDVSYGQIRAVAGLSLEVNDNEIVALLGSNGAGKSTTLMALSGVVPTAAGKVLFGGQDITRMPAHERVRAGLVQVPEGRRVFYGLSVEENLKVGGRRADKATMERIMEEVYEMFPILRERRLQNGGTLSGGEQQMLAIGRALMSQPKVLLLDEPSLGLSPKLADQVLDTVSTIRSSGTTVVIVEQNAERALELADRAYVLETGRLVASGPCARLAADNTIRRAYLGEMEWEEEE
jgi:branched-chain amino acid transport system ATP-binding protein